MECQRFKLVIESITPNSITAQAHIKPNTQILLQLMAKKLKIGKPSICYCNKNGEPNVEKLPFLLFGSNVEQQRTFKSYKLDIPILKRKCFFEALGIMPMRPKIEMVLSKVVHSLESWFYNRW